MGLPLALACSFPSFVEGKLAGLEKLLVMEMVQACSSPSYREEKPGALAKTLASACLACSSAFAEERAQVTLIVWATPAEQACSFPACCLSDSDLQDSFVSAFCSF